MKVSIDKEDDALYFELDDVEIIESEGAELVVLAACETAVGSVFRGEGPISLARPFLSAGASTVARGFHLHPAAIVKQSSTQFRSTIDGDLLSDATDTYLAETIARGRRGTSMYSFREASTVHPSLSKIEIEAIVTSIRTWEK